MKKNSLQIIIQTQIYELFMFVTSEVGPKSLEIRYRVESNFYPFSMLKT